MTTLWIVFCLLPTVALYFYSASTNPAVRAGCYGFFMATGIAFFQRGELEAWKIVVAVAFVMLAFVLRKAAERKSRGAR
jgi:hypothetical protein